MTTPQSNKEGQIRFKEFLSGSSKERHFNWPTCHPTRPTGFCTCDGPVLPRLWFYCKAGLLLWTLRGPFNRPKIWLLRKMGASIGEHVYISADAWIDPLYPQLLTIEDDVMIGVGVRIALHEFGPDHFRAGRVIIRQGAVVGGFSLIGQGVEIGANAVVAGGAVVGRDVPAGKLAVGNPARAVPLVTTDKSEPEP